MREFVINKSNSGRKSATYISKLLPKASFGFIQKMIRKKNITLNDKKMSGNELLKPGDVIKIYFSEDTFNSFSQETQYNENEYLRAYQIIKGVKIIYEDDSFIILYKPVNVLSQKADNQSLSLNEWLIGYLISQNRLNLEMLSDCKPSICNRLDRNTKGLVLGAKTVHGLNTLNTLIKDRKIEKHYIASCIGLFSVKQGTVSAYLSKDEINNKSIVISEKQYNMLTLDNQNNYKAVRLSYTVLQEKSKNGISYSDVDVDLITGKSHQIRAQLSFLGHPLLGDEKYGDRNINSNLRIKGQQLTAYKLIFPKDDNLGYLSEKTIALEE